jgi:hypothetical protein
MTVEAMAYDRVFIPVNPGNAGIAAGAALAQAPEVQLWRQLPKIANIKAVLLEVPENPLVRLHVCDLSPWLARAGGSCDNPRLPPHTE